MVKKKKKDALESFYFTVDDWSREYRFGINHHRWDFDPDHHSERDEICIAGRLRSKTRRKVNTGEIHLLPSYVPRNKYSDEAERIGNVWVDDGRLHCSAFIPSDAYHSLSPCLAANRFAEMVMGITNLRYNKGRTDSIRLHFRRTPLDEHDEIDLPVTHAAISSV